MSVNLIAATKDVVTTQILKKAAIYLNEAEERIYTAVIGIIPFICSGLYIKCLEKNGSQLITQLAIDQYKREVHENTGTLIGEGDDGVTEKSSGIINNIFGNKSVDISKAIAAYAGIQISSANGLLSAITPLMLSVAGKNIIDKNLSVADVTAWLHDQKNNIVFAIPAGLNICDVLGKREESLIEKPLSGKEHQVETLPGHVPAVFNKLIIPAIFLALLGIGGIFYYSTRISQTKSTGTIKENTFKDSTTRANTQ